MQVGFNSNINQISEKLRCPHIKNKAIHCGELKKETQILCKGLTAIYGLSVSTFFLATVRYSNCIEVSSAYRFKYFSL